MNKKGKAMKKALSVISLLLVLCMLAACTASQAPVEAQDSQENVEAAEPATSASAEAQAVVDESTENETVSEEPAPQEQDSQKNGGFEAAPDNITYPLTAEDNVITFYQALGQGIASQLESYNDSYIDQSITAATGIDMQFVEVSDSIISERYNLMIAAGDYTDVITCDQYYSGGTAQAYADEVIIDLTDMVYDNCPSYYNKLYNTNEASICKVTSQGRILAIYSIKDRTFTDSGEMTRGDWLEELGMEVPKTLQQLTDTFYAFKNNYGCEYTVKCDSSGVLDFVGAFDTVLASLSGTDVSVFVKDGQVFSGYTADGYREYVEWFSGLYADGIIHRDFYTTNLFPDVFNGLVGSGDMGFWNSMADGLANIYAYTDDPDFQQVPLATVTMNEGDVYTFQDEELLAGGMQSAGYAITCDCDDPELVLQFFNYFFTDAGSKLRNYGVEGETYTRDAQGNIAFTEMITDNELGMAMNNALNFYTCVQVCPGYTEADSLWACYNDEALAAMEVWLPTGNSDSTYPVGAALNTDETDSISNSVSDITSAASEYILKFMTGSEPITDESWNAYVQELDVLGLSEVLQVYQTAYDEYLAGER